jgi:hypothetical protein
MPHKTSVPVDQEPLSPLGQETLYVGVDIGKKAHVAGFTSVTLLTRHQRFEHCPALTFENSREGFRSLIDRIRMYVPLTQVQVVLEVDFPLASCLACIFARIGDSCLSPPCPEEAGGSA